MSVVDDTLWAAVAEPSRRRLLDALLVTPGSTASALATELPLTRQAIAKHLGVLARAGLVTVAKSGREVQYNVETDRLADASAALREAGARWDQRLLSIKRIAETIERERQAPESQV